MNLTWHIVKKDLRALKWPLAVWTLIIIGKLSVGVALLMADGTEGPEWFMRMDIFSKLLAGLEGVNFVLVAALIHEDLLVGTTAFWQTRPISGARLLRAKLLGIGLVFGFLPVLVTLPWWLGCGYGLREIAWAAAETVVIQAIFVLVGLLWAVVSDGFARFLMWTLVMLIAIPSVTGVVGMHLSHVHPSPTEGVMWTRTWLVVSLAVLGIVTVAIHQFLTRRTWRSVSVIGATVGLIIMVALWWPWDWQLAAKWHSFLERRVEADWPVSAAPGGLTFSLAGAELAPPAPGARPGRPIQMRVNYHVQGVPESQALLPYVANYSLHWPDGSADEGWSWIRPGRNLNGIMRMKVLGSPLATSEKPEDSQAIQSVPAAVAERLQAGPAAYTLKARFGLMEIESMTSVPLQPGARAMIGPLGERIAHVEKEGEQLLVTFVRHSPFLGYDALMGGQNYILGVGRAMMPQFPQYLLVNRTRDYSDRGSAQWGQKFRVGTVEISWQTVAYRASKKAGGPRPLLEAINALNEAELIKFTFQEKARFAHEFKADQLVVTPANP